MRDTLDPIDKLIGSRLRARREQLGLSQSQIGDSIGVSFQQIQKYEKGFNRLAASKVSLLSEVLQVSPTFFFTGSLDDRTEGQLLFDDSHVKLLAEQDRESRRLLTAFGQITSGKNRSKVLSIVEALADAFEGRRTDGEDHDL